MKYDQQQERIKTNNGNRKRYLWGVKRFIPFNVSEQHVCMRYCSRLRKTEYYLNSGRHFLFLISKLILNRMQIRTGLLIPPNTCGEGLSIAHMGPIIIHGKAKIGKNTRIHAGVNIGANGGNPPIIGDNCYIGPGAKVFGDITITDGVSIGANAVVNHDCPEKNGVYVGVPAKFIKYRER